jgi:hypothetical protein
MREQRMYPRKLLPKIDSLDLSFSSSIVVALLLQLDEGALAQSLRDYNRAMEPCLSLAMT